MDLDRQRLHRAQGAKGFEDVPNLRPIASELAAGHADEFIQHLHADRSSGREEGLGPVRLGLVLAQQIQNDIGVEKIGLRSHPRSS
jgi:hypothetical protein